MKLLMENWRTFLKESRITLDDVALYQVRHDSSFYFILYRVYNHPAIQRDVVSVIGRITVSPTLEPCIPETYQVDSIYVDKPYRDMGFGSTLYNIAFLFADYRKMGLTSDKVVGTNKKAADQWLKFDNRSNYVKKATSQGNDKFDYTGRETPLDPDDDCSMPAMAHKNATDHSFIKTDAASFRSKYLEMYKLHPVNVDKVLKAGLFRDQAALEKYIERQAEDDFQLNYADEPE